MRKAMDKKKNDKFDVSKDPFYTLNTTASANECTGLVPSGILEEAEGENYGELYAIHPPQPDDQPKKEPGHIKP